MSDREHRIPPTSWSVHKPRVGKITDGPRLAPVLRSGPTALLRRTSSRKMLLLDAPRANERHGWSRDFQFYHLYKLQQAPHPLLQSKDMCPLGLEALPARVLLPLCPSLLASHLFRSLVGLALLSLCTTKGPVVRSLVVSLLTKRALRPQRSSSDLGVTAIMLGSVTSFDTISDNAVRTWIWRSRLQLQCLPDL